MADPKMELNLNYLNEVGRNRPEFIKRMLSYFSEQVPELVRNIVDALDDKEFKKLEQKTHELKNIVSYFELPVLVTQLAELEKASQKGDCSAEHLLNTSQIIEEVTAFNKAIDQKLNDLN